MRLEGIRINEVIEEIFGQAFENANDFMDDVAKLAKARLESKIIQRPPIVRKGSFGSAHVSFTPKTGKNKGSLVEFDTDKRWTGRHNDMMDTLKRTIRRVDKPKSWSVRVYAGNLKTYWAFMIEKGYHDRSGKYHPGYHYLQEPFHSMKKQIVNKIKHGR